MKYRHKVKQQTNNYKRYEKHLYSNYSLRKEKAWHVLFLYLECRMKKWWD